LLSGRKTHARWRNIKETDHLEDLDVDDNTLLEWMLITDGTGWTGLIWLRIERGMGLYGSMSSVKCKYLLG
jgi:hypothetical protein